MAGRLNLSTLRSRAANVSDAALPLPQVLPIGTPPPKLGVVQSPGKIGFTLAGVLRWQIDVGRFAGTPTLATKTDKLGTTRITLAGARLPGTLLPADFVLTVAKTGPLGTPGEFTFTLGGLHATVVLERWLAGSERLQSPVTLAGEVCALGAQSSLAFSANGEARFTPDWEMEIGGSGVATITGLGDPILSDHLTFEVLAPSDPTITNHPKAKRTLLTLPAGANSWTLTPAVTSLPIGNLTASPGLFDNLSIEAGEGPAGDIARELLATSSSTTGLTLAVAGGFADLNGTAFSLALASPSYAIAFDASADHSLGDQTFLIARFGPIPGWMVVDGFVLLVGDAPSPGFELDTMNGAVTAFRCAPELIAAAAPLSAASGSILAAQPREIINAVLPFVTAPGAAPGWGLIAGPEVAGRRRFSLPDFNVSVLRREDLLALDFSFFNLAFEGGGGTPPQLVLKDPTLSAFLVAQFDSPQNIAEQAYLEAFTDTAGHTAPPGGNPQTLSEEKPGSSAAFPAIAQTRAAGPSRLAFRFPTDTST